MGLAITTGGTMEKVKVSIVRTQDPYEGVRKMIDALDADKYPTTGFDDPSAQLNFSTKFMRNAQLVLGAK